MKKSVICTLAGALAIVGAGQAHALVLQNRTEAQAIRQELSKKVPEQLACLVKATLACEASSTTLGADCSLLTAGTQNGADAKGKYAAAIAKCDAKWNVIRKNKSYTDAGAYEAIGCPGDSDSNTNGNQRYTNMSSYQVGANLIVKNQLHLLSLILASSVDTDPAAPGNQSCGDEKCLARAATGLLKYVQALQKCIIACENDYSGKKGNGGPTDGSECLVEASGISGAAGSAPAFDACVDKAWASANKKPLALGSLAGGVGSLLGNLAQRFFDAPSNCP